MNSLKCSCVCLVIVFVLVKFVSPLPIANPNTTTTEGPTTLISAIIDKCPATQNTTLNDTFSKLLNKNCGNWPVITNTKFNTNRTTDQCLLVYDSLLGFCKKIGEHVLKFKGDLLSAALDTKTDTNKVCINGAFKDIIKPEHNISNILDSNYCFHICSEEIDGKYVTTELCNVAYYFAAFDVKGFLKKFEEVKPQIPIPLEDVKKQAKEKKKEADKVVANEKKKEADKVIAKDTPPPPSHPVETQDLHNQKEAEKVMESPPKEVDDDEDNNQPALDPNEFEELKPDTNIKNTDAVDKLIPSNNGDVQIKKLKPNTSVDEPISNDIIANDEEELSGDSYFFSYFSVFMCLMVIGYVAYHNRQKIFALILEGKRGRRNGTRPGRRPNSANYHKLDSNLEEAMLSSTSTKSASHVVY